MTQVTPVPLRPRAARAARAPQPIPDDIAQLMKVAREKEPHLVAQFLRRKLNAHLDDELEVLASHVLSEADFDTRIPEVMGPLNRGDTDGAMLALVSRMRRKFAKMLRDHQRGESDDFFDDCLVE